MGPYLDEHYWLRRSPSVKRDHGRLGLCMRPDCPEAYSRGRLPAARPSRMGGDMETESCCIIPWRLAE